MTRFCLWVIAFSFVWPLQFSLASIDTKGIDLVVSDLLPLMLPVIYLLEMCSQPRMAADQLRRQHASTTIGTGALPAILFSVYCFSLAAIGLGMSGEMVRVLSAVKLVKTIMLFPLAMVFCSKQDPLELIHTSGRAFGLIAGLTMFFTATDAAFPFDRWGRHIFGYELYGYPNAPMSFYGACVPLVLAAADTTKVKAARLFWWGMAFFAAMLILGSMSRSSILVLTSGILIYLARTGRTPFLITCCTVIALLSIFSYGLFAAVKDTQIGTVLVTRLQARAARTTENEDPSSGRFEIWEFAAELCAEKPLFGYMFESFSNYAEYDTPHQQYLEILYKSGGIGFLLYVWLIWSCLSRARVLCAQSPPRSPPWYRLHAMRAMFIAVLIGNLTQPNLSYSLLGNMVFVLFGALSTHRAALVVQEAVRAAQVKTPVAPVVPARTLRRAS